MIFHVVDDDQLTFVKLFAIVQQPEREQNKLKFNLK